MIGHIAYLTSRMAPLRDELLAAQEAERRAANAYRGARTLRKIREREMSELEAAFANLIIAQVRPADSADSEFVTFEDADDLIDALTKGDDQ